MTRCLDVGSTGAFTSQTRHYLAGIIFRLVFTHLSVQTHSWLPHRFPGTYDKGVILVVICAHHSSCRSYPGMQDPEIMLQNMSHQYDPRRGDTAPLTTGTTNPDPISTRTKAGGRSSRGTGSGSGRTGRSNTPQKAAARDRVAGKKAPSNTVSTNVTPNPTTRTPPHYQRPTALTERNVARLLGAGGRGGPMGGVLACTGGGGAVGRDGPAPWGMEVGAAARVKRYMETRHTERAARQARLENVTRNLLQTL